MRAVVHDVLVAAVVGLGVHRVGALQPERVARVDLVRRVVAARAGVVVERVAIVVVGRSGKGRWRPVRRRGGRRHRARTACRTKRRSRCLERRTRGRRRRLRGRAAGGQRQRGGEAASADRHRARLRRNLRTRLSGFSRAVGVVVCVGCGGGAPPPPRSLSLACLSKRCCWWLQRGRASDPAPPSPLWTDFYPRRGELALLGAAVLVRGVRCLKARVFITTLAATGCAFIMVMPIFCSSRCWP